jgi:DNA-binding CsgD family transcriptional regulator/PAS domain-containing protein
MKRQELSPDAIADIYEAAIDDERWPQIAQLVAKATEMPTTGVWFIDGGEVVDMALTAELDETQRPYLAHYAKLDMWRQNLLRGPFDWPRLGYELFSERELLKTEFYNDFARHYGVFRPMSAVIRFARDSFATIATNRPGSQRLVEEGDKPKLVRVIPHMRRALQLRLNQRRHSLRAPVHAAAFDALAFGAIICDRAGRIVFANRAAEGLAKAGEGIVLGSHGKGLGAIVPAEARALGALVYRAATEGSGGVMRLTGRGGFTSLMVLVTPLPRNYGLEDSIGRDYALVTLRSASDSPSFSSDMLIALFGLSPTQAAIALAIFAGKAPEQVAAERDLAISTLRTHLAEIFRRTGAENQRDLVRLLGMLPPVRAQRE